MEFLELLLIFIAIYIVWKKPEKEKLAFGLFILSWVIMVVSYVGHVSSNLLPVMNL